MDPATIAIIILSTSNVVSYVMHYFHFKNKTIKVVQKDIEGVERLLVV